MIYRSNIQAPDLSAAFAATTICEVRPWSMGHDVLSDSEFDPNCGFMTHDEAAILHECALRVTGMWADIGSRFGWSTAHIAAADCAVVGIDPGYHVDSLLDRSRGNVYGVVTVSDRFHGIRWFVGTSSEFFGYCDREQTEGPFSGVCIDGNHDAPEPLNDARGALDHLADTGVIVFHDFWGRPIREGVEYLMSQGLQCRVYDTPNGMAVCWRGHFAPPDHTPDPTIDWSAVRAVKAPEFDFSRCV